MTDFAAPLPTYEQSDQIAKLALSLSNAQGAFTGVTKSKTAEIRGAKASYSFAYSDLASVLEAVRRPLAENGLAIVQGTGRGVPAGVEVTTTLLHASGEWVRSRLVLACDGEPRAVGSAISYARRYALMALLGVASEDDDAQAATRGGRGQAAPEPAQEPAPRTNRPSLISAFRSIGVQPGDIQRRLGHSLTEITDDEAQELVEIGKAIRAGSPASEWFGPGAVERMREEIAEGAES